MQTHSQFSGPASSSIGLRREIRKALARGVRLPDIERTLLDRPGLEEDRRDALWLYAWALSWRMEQRGIGPIRAV